VEKSWNLKIGQEVVENRENLEETWKSHGILPPDQKLKIFKYQVFPKNGLRRIPPHIPRRSAYCIFYLNEGVILLIFKCLRPLIFCKSHGNFIPGKVYKP
jgi:hypothetical protein